MSRQRETLEVGDGTLTKRILKRCRDAGIEYETVKSLVRIGRGRHAWKTKAYMVPKVIHDEEVERRNIELVEKNRRQKLESKRRRAIARQKQIDDLAERFPKLADEMISELVESGTSIFASNDIGYQYGLGTKTYWARLGFKVTGKPTGVVAKGNKLFDLYRARILVPKRSRMSVIRLRALWTEKYGCDELVLAQAIRFGNRLQKVHRHNSFYTLKDRWIESQQEHLTEGRIARVESRKCWGCDGTGYKHWGDECWKCTGTGVYSMRTLYEHTFEIAGQRFVFHSYTRPCRLSEEYAPDLKVYGRPFEADELPCPPQAVIVELIEVLLAQVNNEAKDEGQ